MHKTFLSHGPRLLFLRGPERPSEPESPPKGEHAEVSEARNTEQLERRRRERRRLHATLGSIDAAENRLAKAASHADRTTLAVLAKAFAGELVETEADLARREGRDYEPATVLLERIAAELVAADNGKPRRARQSKSKQPTNRKKALKK